MAAEVTEAAVRRTLESVELLARLGAGFGLLNPNDIAAICRSWLEQNEALRWTPVTESKPADVFYTLGPLVEVTDATSRDVGVARWNKDLKRWVLCDPPRWNPTHWREIGPLPKEGE